MLKRCRWGEGQPGDPRAGGLEHTGEFMESHRGMINHCDTVT